MLSPLRGRATRAVRALHASASAALRVQLQKARGAVRAALRVRGSPSASPAPPQDVPSLGLAGEVVDVTPGHARNFLVPGRLAVPLRAPGRGRGASAEQERASAPSAAAAARADPAMRLEEALEAVRRLTVAPLVRAPGGQGRARPTLGALRLRVARAAQP